MDLSSVAFALIFLIAVALLFDFLNGLHDAANSIATIVSTRVLAPQWAVFWAAFFNFIAFLFFGLHVAQTVGSGIVQAAIVDDRVIFGALTGAITWNVVTWLAGIPSSSSHALIGGLVGAALTKVGFSGIVWWGLGKTFVAIFMSPAIGFLLALLLVLIVSWTCLRVAPMKVDSSFRLLQFVSASLYSLGHGANDAQKTMGIIAVLLFSHGYMGDTFEVPFWVVISCQAAMAIGTLFGGWRIVHTMGSKITRLTPQQGFCAETGGAITLFAATSLGVPVSTTHTITGAIVGVGAARRVSAVRWGVARGIVVAWIITMPMSGLNRGRGLSRLRPVPHGPLRLTGGRARRRDRRPACPDRPSGRSEPPRRRAAGLRRSAPARPPSRRPSRIVKGGDGAARHGRHLAGLLSCSEVSAGSRPCPRRRGVASKARSAALTSPSLAKVLGRSPCCLRSSRSMVASFWREQGRPCGGRGLSLGRVAD